MFALVTGKLYGAVEQKTSKTGKTFVSTRIKVQEGDITHWVRLLVFSERAREELLRACNGDAMSARGNLKIEPYTTEGGETRIGLTRMADQILPLRGDRKKPAADDPRPSAPPRERPAPRWDASSGMRVHGAYEAEAGLDDSLDF